MDFSEYKIYIGPNGDPGHLMLPQEENGILKEEFIYPFERGIKKLQEEKKPLYLDDAWSKDASIYIEKTYNIWTY